MSLKSESPLVEDTPGDTGGLGGGGGGGGIIALSKGTICEGEIEDEGCITGSILTMLVLLGGY